MKRRAAQPPRGPYTTPLRQLRRRLTFVFTVLTGTVLTVFLAITLGLAQKQTQLSAQSMFDASVDTLIVTLQTGSVSDTALAQTEAADGLLIFITDNGTPLFFSGGWAPATPRGTLLERAAEAGLAEGVNMDAAPRSSVYASRVTVTVEGNAGEHYTAAVCSVPGQRGWYGLAVLRDDGPLRRTLTRQALLYAALLSGGLALLGAVNWFLAGRALRPTAEALQKQREFVAAAGHELRGPLAVVKTSLSAMQASPADTPQYLAAIGSEADRMARLVDDLLLLAGSDAGTWRMRMEPVDADALVIGAHEQFAPLVKARGLRLALDLPEETHAPVHHQRRNGPFQRCHSTAARARHINRPLSRPCTYRVAIVDVQADKIRPYVDDRQVFRRERRRHTPQAGPAVFRIMSETDRVQHHLIGKCPVAVRRGEGSAAGSLHIGGAVRAGPAQPPCRGDADAHAGAGLPNGGGGKAVSQKLMVQHQKLARLGQTQARGMHARTVAQLYSTLRLIERNVILCKAAETARRLGGIAGKSTGGLSAAPAARIFQRLGQFPVVQCDIRLQARSAAGLEHAQIKRKPFPVPAAVAVRVHPRPAHAETVSTEAHLRRAGNVLLISAVRVRGGGTVKPVCNGAWAAAEYVPNGFPAAVGPRAALGLVSAGGRAPYKIFCKRHMSPPFSPSSPLHVLSFRRARRAECRPRRARRPP